MNNQVDTVRGRVSRDYARAVGEPVGGTSCAAECGCLPKGVAAQVAGYTEAEMEGLPAGAVENSFGCGNPLAFADVAPGDIVLDLGSGAGIDVLLAARKVGPAGRAIGIDMTDEMLAKARENIAAAGAANAEVRKGIIEQLPVDGASVDWVISNCVINLSPEKHRVFAEIARVLKPGGRVRISDIVVECLPDWVRDDESLYSACVAGAISEPEYVGGLREAGLTDVEVTERLVYDRAQLEALIRSEVPRESAHAAERAAILAGEMVGKVWSARFSARKPGHRCSRAAG
jgi:arsenite methyltransferase